MDLKLKDRPVLVAGGSRGIGLGIAASLLAEGAKLAITARGADDLEGTRRRLAADYGEDRVWAMAGDMRETAAIERAVEGAEAALGPLWGAVANVGLFPCPPGFEVDDDTWDQGFAQNLDSAYRLARTTLRGMTERGEGSFLFISSTAGLEAMNTSLTYGTSKAAMVHLAKELAKIGAPSGVRVNVIAPGTVVFEGNNWDQRTKGPQAEGWARWLKREVPMNRYGTPEEIGVAAAFLLSPVASYITGAIVPVDGGQIR
jgi:3-oxoacyl-[acyl-carrier protein] reductase